MIDQAIDGHSQPLQGIDSLSVDENDAPQLDREAVLVYASVVRSGSLAVSDIVQCCRLDPTVVHRSVAALRALGLLSIADAGEGGRGDRMVAQSPTTTLTYSLAPREQALREQQQRLSHLREQVEGLLPVYAEQAGDSSGGPPAESVHDLATVRALITDLAAQCTEEVLTGQPGGARPGEVLRESLGRTECLLRRGVRMRTLYQHAARFNPTTMAYVKHVTALGTQVRTVGGELQRMIVFDRTVAVLPLHDNPVGALVVRNRSLIEFIVSVFEQAWASGEPCGGESDPRLAPLLSSKVKLSIVRLLAGGHSDRTTARRLGISERTCQRHIAEIFQQIGARSRFHAGYLISQAGDLGELVSACSDAPPPGGVPAQRTSVVTGS